MNIGESYNSWANQSPCWSHGRPRFSRDSNDVVVLCPSCPKPGTCVPCHRQKWRIPAMGMMAEQNCIESYENVGGFNCWFRLGIPSTHIYIYYIYIIYTYINQMYIFCRVMQQAGKCICSATCKLNIQKDAQISGRSRTRLFLWLHDWLHQSLHPWTSKGDLGHDFIVWCRWTQQFDFWELNKKQMGDLRLRATPKVS